MASQHIARLRATALSLSVALGSALGPLFLACSIDDVVAYGAAGAGGIGGSASGAAGNGGSAGGAACDPACTCLELQGSSYMVCRDQVNRQQAEMRCTQYGMQLVRPDSQEENFLVRGAASNSELTSFWLGCNDSATEGTVVWYDGVPLAQTYSNFIDIDPADNEGQDCCVEYASASWHDEPCDSPQGVVCELY